MHTNARSTSNVKSDGAAAAAPPPRLFIWHVGSHSTGQYGLDHNPLPEYGIYQPDERIHYLMALTDISINRETNIFDDYRGRHGGHAPLWLLDMT
jgi:hypothetical protein